MLEPPVLQKEFDQLYRQNHVPPDATATPIALDTDDLSAHQGYGCKVLLLIPPENYSITALLASKIRKEVQEAELIVHSEPVKTRVVQLYNEGGAISLVKRIEEMTAFIKSNDTFLEENRVGTIVIGAIENYVRISKMDGSAADFGVAILYNTKTHRILQGISRGVPVQKEFLEKARQEGFWDGGINEGKFTVGEILKIHFDDPARRKYGQDYDIAKDWRRVVCGASQCDLLKGVLDELGPIL
ncbi:hypothetical protein IQ07DRAFT_668720 [Pyrenochaeta sp. DS3sAY3a]|nr:hypothetical protein IQ07DRAFT_668720 [Pyrenochaeta sp. DS3sAY3a]